MSEIRDYNIKKIKVIDGGFSGAEDDNFVFVTNTSNKNKNPGKKNVNLDNKIKHINIV